MRTRLLLAVGFLSAVGLGCSSKIEAAPVCVEVSSACVDTADRTINGEVVSKPCWRYEKRLRCYTPHEDAAVCAIANLPTGCTAGKAVCTQKDDVMGCLETSTPLTCTVQPTSSASAAVSMSTPMTSETGLIDQSSRTGILLKTTPSAARARARGIIAGNPKITVTYSESISGDASLGDGCAIAKETCLDSKPRSIPISNWSGHTATASPACWKKEVTVSCPSADAAESCRALESAGCTATGDPVCTARTNGVCVRWEKTYRCGSPVTGDGIDTGTSEEVPDGGVSVNDSACRTALDKQIAAGLSCEALSSVCEVPGETITVDGRPVVINCRQKRVRYRCTAEGKAGCAALEASATDGTCRRETDPVCKKKDASGNCLVYESIFRCGPESAVPPDTAEDLGDVKEESAVPVNGCSAWEANAKCRETARTCTEGPGLRWVDGKYVYKDCWAWRVTHTCLSNVTDDCAVWEKDPECRLVSSVCPDGETGDACLRPLRTYECTRPAEDLVLGEICGGEVCIGDVCQPTDGGSDKDLADSLVQIEIGRQLGVYGDLTGNRFFSGDALTCKDRKGAPSCCRKETVANVSNDAFRAFLLWGLTETAMEAVKYVGSPYVYDLLAWSDKTDWLLNALYGNAPNGVYNPSLSFWGVSASLVNGRVQFSFSVEGFAMAAAMQLWQNYKTCDAEDQKLAMARGQGLCHFIGTRCAERVPGLGCTKREEVHGCFNSKLALIINEQGRKQLGRNWGTASAPDARGFTMEEIEALDFSRMDFTAFIQDILREIRDSNPVNDAATHERIEERLREMLSGENGIFGPVDGPSGATSDPETVKESKVLRKLRKGAFGKERPISAFRRPGLSHPNPRITAYLRRNGFLSEDEIRHYQSLPVHWAAAPVSRPVGALQNKE